MRYCIHCGMPMEEDDRFCTRCGKEVTDPSQEPLQGGGAGTETLREGYGGDPQMIPPAGFRRSGRENEGPGGGYSRDPGAAFPGRQDRGGGYPVDYSDYEDYADEEDEETGLFGGGMDRNRLILAASAVITAAVIVILLLMLVLPSRKKDGEDEGSAQDQVASYDTDGTAGGQQTAGQGEVRPESGQETGQSAAADSGSGDAQAGGSQAGAAGQNVGNGTGRPEQPAADGNAGAQAGGNSGNNGNNGNGGSSGSDGEEYGWVTDEDGNSVYYPAEGEQISDNDQTEVGGDYAGGSGESEKQSGTGQEVQQQSTDTEETEESKEAEESGQNALDGFSNTGSGNDYILPESASRYYTRKELEKLDNSTLQMAINEIYARHGRKFDTPEIRAYFESKSWYRGTIDPAAFDGNEANYFNQYEMGNRELMAAIRSEREAAASGTRQ